MPTLQAYREQMLTRQNDPAGFGRVENITALAAQSATCASLAFGTIASTKYLNKWMVRPTAALVGGVAVDRVRMCSAATTSSGLLTHAGTAYADTTVGTEVLEILEYEPALLDASINTALQRLRRRDVEIIPTSGTGKYWLGQLSWINEPGDVAMVKYRPCSVLSRNRFFQKWNIATPGTAAATALPDWWVLSGASATSARVTANVYQPGQYGCQIVAGGAAAAVMTQTVGLLSDGVSTDTLAGKIVTIILVGRATAASKLRGFYSDDGGTTKQYTPYHTGDSTQQDLPLQVTISTTASNPVFGWETAISATTSVSQCYLTYGAISAGVRLDDTASMEIEKQWDQTAGPGAMVLRVPNYGMGGQIEIHSKRNYPTLTLDSDTADAPLVHIATGALFLLYQGLASTAGEDDTRYTKLAQHWQQRYSLLAGKHYNDEFGDIGVNFPPKQLTPWPSRVG